MNRLARVQHAQDARLIRELSRYRRGRRGVVEDATLGSRRSRSAEDLGFRRREDPLGLLKVLRLAPERTGSHCRQGSELVSGGNFVVG